MFEPAGELEQAVQLRDSCDQQHDDKRDHCCHGHQAALSQKVAYDAHHAIPVILRVSKAGSHGSPIGHEHVDRVVSSRALRLASPFPPMSPDG
jgi:hypothetical protein